MWIDITVTESFNMQVRTLHGKELERVGENPTFLPAPQQRRSVSGTTDWKALFDGSGW